MNPDAKRSRIKPWMLVSAIWIWPAALNVVNRILQVKLQGWDPPTFRELVFTAGDWLIYAVVTPAIFAISARWPVRRPHVRRGLLIHAGWALFFCVVWATAGKLLDLVLVSILEPARIQAAISAAGPNLTSQVAANVAGWILTTLPFGAVVYLTVAGMAHAVNYFTEARDRDIELARLSEQLTGARFAALQAQLNPHFLFNTLNTIAVLVRDGDRVGAVRIVEQLSEVLRRTLSRHRASEVTLDEEIELVRQYLAIERARFSDRLRVTIEAGETLAAAAVPSFAVQHLVENAIRHGIARRAEAGVLRVVARRDGDTLEVTVTDDGPGVRGAVDVAGHGLANTRERLRGLYGDRAALTVTDAPGGGTVATLRVPYRELVIDNDDAAR